MAFNLQVGTLTQPGSPGNAQVDLASNFDPKALILWGSPVAAAGTVARGDFCIGYGTYRGAAVAMCNSGFRSEDGLSGFANARRHQSTTQLFSLLDTAGSAVDCEIDLVSMATGASSNFIVNWVNLHATASIKVNYMVLGGDEITDALAGSFAPTGTTQDVALASFGHPDLIFFASQYGMTTNETGLDHIMWSTGFAKRGESGRSTTLSIDANTASGARAAFQATYNNRALVQWDVAGAAGTSGQRMSLNAEGGWPANGFEVGWDSAPADPGTVMYLALKGTFNITTGESAAPTGTGDVNLAHGAAPKGAFLLHARTATANTQDASSADDGSIGVGAGDGTNEAWAGAFSDDAATTTQENAGWTNTKVFRSYSPATPTLESEADGTISGNNFVLGFTDADSAAHLFQWVTLGSSAAPGTAKAGVGIIGRV